MIPNRFKDVVTLIKWSQKGRERIHINIIQIRRSTEHNNSSLYFMCRLHYRVTESGVPTVYQCDPPFRFGSAPLVVLLFAPFKLTALNFTI